MKKRTKLFATLLGVIAVVVSVLCLVACNDKKEYTYKFVTYDNQSISVKGTEGGNVKFPSVERENYAFDGWYVSASFGGEPVTSAKFTSNVTLYAKWTPVYAANLDLDGGSLDGVTDNKLYVRLGANIAEFMKDYEPAKGEYKFGGWYVGDVKLPDTAVMTENGINLTARYMAEYTLNAYLQKPDLDGYDYNASYKTGYALIDDELDLETLSVKGFEFAEAEGDRSCDIIDADKAKNVFTMHFDRSLYEVVFNANYPDGSADEHNELHLYGVEFDLPTDTFSFEGARFLGWAEKADADYTRYINDGKYTLQNQTTTLYAQWNVGYSDMFMGYDTIFVNPDKQGAVLCRGGVDIAGTYDSDRNYYVFRGEEHDGERVTLRARLTDTHKFIFYDDRSGSYTLYEDGYLNKNVTLSIDNLNNVNYYDNTPDFEKIKRGTYTISEENESYYVAEFTDGTSFTFVLGMTTDNTPSFRIRGDEYKYGVMAQKATYYPLIELDGFGNVLFLQGAQYDVERGAYAIEGNMLAVSLLSGPTYSFKLFKYNGSELYNGYEVYDKDWDTDAAGKRPYTGAMAQIRLDGCSNARYSRSGGSDSTAYYDAKYDELVQSIQGGYILTLTQTDGTVTKFRLYDAVMGAIVIPTFDELDPDYNEYMYADPDGMRAGSPYLIVDGNKGKTYEVNAQKEPYLASIGTLEKLADGSYKYTPTKFEADAQTKFKSITLRLDTTNTPYSYYYRLSVTDEEDNTETYGAVYNQKDGTGTLKLVSAFAYYTDSKSKTVIGAYNDYTTFIAVSVDGKDYYYFILDKDNNEFEVLAKSPMKLTKREIVPETGNFKTTSTVTLTITGRTDELGAFESIYVNAETGETFSGYSVEKTIEILELKGVIYTFTSTDGSLQFKYYIAAASSRAYFVYFETSAAITLATYGEINDDDLSDATKKLVVTDEFEGENCVVLYVDGGTELRGYVVKNAPHYAFDEYTVVTYGFYDLTGVKQFDFTVVETLFRKCAENETFTSKGGATLELDGAVHKARYTYADGVRHVDRDYLIDTSDGMRTVVMYIGDTYYFFDIMDEETNTFEMRGVDSALYIMVCNGNIQTADDPDDEDGLLVATVYLDGHGHATLSYLKEGAPETTGTYTGSGDVYTITVKDRTIVGKLGVLAVGDSRYHAFYVSMDNSIAGTYLDKTSLAVLELDDVGNVVKYNTYGQRIVGTYLRLDDNLFYYVNTANTDGAMYTLNKITGEIIASDYRTTFYSDSFGSIVFYVNGVVLVNNDTSDVTYFSQEGGKLYSYSYNPDADGNKYGYVRSERFVINTETQGTETVKYIALDGVKYYEFDGKYVTFTDADGATLTFQPTGDAVFTAAATYRANGSDKDVTLFAVVAYNDDGEVETFLANYENRSIAGSRYDYSTFVSWDLELHFAEKSFVYNPNLATFDFLAYDSMYIQTYQTIFANMYYGQIYVVGKEKADGSVDYTVAGQINYVTVEITDENGETKKVPLTFTDGSLAQVGAYNSQYGHMFTTEFTANDGELYHLNFFMLPGGVYMIYSLTRVTATIDCGNGNCLYTEEFVNSYFRVPNGKTNAETGEGEFYAKGDEYLPTLKYNGTVVCVSSIIGYGNEAAADGAYTWEFMTVEYYRTYLQEFAYVLRFTLDDSTGVDVIVPQSLARYNVEGYDQGDNTVVVYEDDDGNINKVYAIYIGKTADLAKQSTYNSADDTYTVTTESGKTYTVKLTKSADENGDEVRSATITEQQESSPEDNA